MSQNLERRKYQRLSLDWSVLVSGVDADENEFREDTQSIDVGSRGIRFLCRNPLSVGQKLQVTIFIPPDVVRVWPLSRFETDGTVIWKQENRQGPVRSHEVGLEFSSGLKFVELTYEKPDISDLPQA